MNKEFKQKWIQALESGNYKHGKSFLKYKDEDTSEIKHCCLGVFCEVIEEKFYPEYEKKEAYHIKEDENLNSIENMLSGVLPNRILNKYGINPSEQSNLYQINDRFETVDYLMQIEYIKKNM